MNVIREITKECGREDCRIDCDSSVLSTCVAWTPTFSRDGKQINSDPNTHTSRASCDSCGKRWGIVTCGSKTDISEIPPLPEFKVFSVSNPDAGPIDVSWREKPITTLRGLSEIDTHPVAEPFRKTVHGPVNGFARWTETPLYSPIQQLDLSPQDWYEVRFVEEFGKYPPPENRGTFLFGMGVS